MILQTWGDVLVRSFQDMWMAIAGFLPNIIIAVVIFVAGWVVASLLGRLITSAVDALKIDSALRGAGVEAVVHKAGYKLHTGRFLGFLVECFVVIVFLIAAFDVLGLSQVNIFLQQVVLLYLPQVIVAVLILMVAGVVAQFVENLVVGSARAASIHSAHLLGTVTRWAIWIFAVLAALYQLGVATPFIQTLFTGVVVALSLAAGLAFGLGGQEAAARFIERVRRDIAEK